MRLSFIYIVVAGLCALGGCPPIGVTPEDANPTGLTAGTTVTRDEPAARSTSGPVIVTGTVGADGDYALLPLTDAATGESWTVSDARGLLGGGSFLVCLFNADNELMQRQIVTAAAPLEHIVRADTSLVYLGVAATAGGAGGDFRFQVSRHTAVVPDTQPQVVWLNFNGGARVTVHGRNPIAFPAFDANLLGGVYAGTTATMKAAILAAMRADYATYNVVIASSDDGPPPEGPYATLHFGGQDARLLGLADNVDEYNTDPWQVAVIYVEDFADFAQMGLSAEEMGQMVGNVASHEFGHLIGLFHTAAPVDLMDTTGTAWDLAADQTFTRAPLERTVFPTGYENSPRRLAETVGTNNAAARTSARHTPTEKMLRQAAVRALVRTQLPSRCGTCLHLDD